MLTFLKKHRVLISTCMFILLWAVSLSFYLIGDIHFNTRYKDNGSSIYLTFKRNGIYIIEDMDKKEIGQGYYSIDGDTIKTQNISNSTNYIEIIDKSTLKEDNNYYHSNNSKTIILFVISFLATIVYIFIVVISLVNKNPTKDAL